MAINRTGSRRIVIDGIAYRWRIPRRPTYDQGVFADALICYVWLEEDGQRELFLHGGPRPDNWLRAAGDVVTPGRIAEAIRRALVVGWRPKERGPAFVCPLSPMTVTIREDGSHA